jgi:histidinol phosphatase-like enzyme
MIEYPDINIHLSAMVGDSLSDMQFAKNLNITAIYLSKGKPISKQVREYTDYFFIDLNDFANQQSIF